MGSESDKTIGERLARLRIEKGLSQMAVAEAMRARSVEHKWSQSTVWAVEKGDRSLKASEVADLAAIVGGGTMMFTRFGQATDYVAKLISLKNDLGRLGELWDQQLAEVAAVSAAMEQSIPTYKRFLGDEEQQERGGGGDHDRLARELVEAEAMVGRVDKLLETMHGVLQEEPAADFWHYLSGKGVHANG